MNNRRHVPVGTAEPDPYALTIERYDRGQGGKVAPAALGLRVLSQARRGAGEAKGILADGGPTGGLVICRSLAS